MNKVMLAFTILFGTLAVFFFTHAKTDEQLLGNTTAVYRPMSPRGGGSVMKVDRQEAESTDRIVAEMVPVRVNGKLIQTALVLKVEDKQPTTQ
jgi:hypothetical protein